VITPGIFGLLLALGAAAIAVWTDVRFPALAPASLRACFVHAAVAFVALAIAPVAVEPMLSGAQLVARFVALFGVVFPVLVYAFLAFVWLAKPLASGLPGR
jgi:hypothetical protein